MHGLRGQVIDWFGVDGAWYDVLSDGEDLHVSVRVTAPLAKEYPDRQLITGFALRYASGHSLVIQVKRPYTTETEGCPSDWFAPCLSENSLLIAMDGAEQEAVVAERNPLAGDGFITAVNMPAECQPYGGDIIWAETAIQINSRRRLPMTHYSFTEWASEWSESTAAPAWCRKFLEEAGVDGVLKYHGKHTVFRIETPALTVRLHHGVNHQGGEVLHDGRILPEMEFWQMDMHLEWYDVDAATVTGILGETIRPVLDTAGVPILYGAEAMRGNVEDYRIPGPLITG